MVRTSVSHLFTDTENRYKVEEWSEELHKNPERYASCSLVNFTRVKNLDSDYKHEYVQFIVEDATTGDRARVYAERANDEDWDTADIVSVGRTEAGFDKWPELPLPLTTLIFDRGSRPGIVRISEILREISRVGGGYNLLGNNCFWFAATTYRTVKAMFLGTEKKWSWINAGGDGGSTLKGAYGLGFSTLFKFAFKSTADDFKKQRENEFSYITPSNFREKVTPEQMADAVVSSLKNERVMDEYLGAMHANGVDVNKDEVEKVALSVQESVAEKSKQVITWTQDFDADVQNFNEKTLTDPEAELLRGLYREKIRETGLKSEEGLPIIERPETYFGPKNSEYYDMERAMDVFAGRVLMRLTFSDEGWHKYIQRREEQSEDLV